jgi:hypothetical protein
MAQLRARGHVLVQGESQGCAEVILYDAASDELEAGVDGRLVGGGAAVR